MTNKTIITYFILYSRISLVKCIKIIVEVEPSCMTIAVLKKLGLVFVQG